MRTIRIIVNVVFECGLSFALLFIAVINVNKNQLAILLLPIKMLHYIKSMCVSVAKRFGLPKTVMRR